MDNTNRRTVTPPMLARELGVCVSKILRWIDSGELKAFNAATTATGRPRWLIDLADVISFKQRRGNQLVRIVEAKRRRQRPRDYTPYFE
jgi:hypothetical protein